MEGVCDACGGKLEARADDKPEVVRDRLQVYHKETAPLKDFYAARNLLKTVDNQPTVAGHDDCDSQRTGALSI